MVLVISLFALWLLLGAYFLLRAQLPDKLFWACFSAMVLALAIRLFCMDHITSDYTDFLSQWAEFFRQNGGFLGIRHAVGDYNVPYLYFMAAISYLPAPDLYLIKLFSIFFDLLLAFTGLRLVRRVFPGKEKSAAAVFCVLLLLPTVVLNGAFWGQCDSVYGALALLALANALEGRGARSVVWLGVAFSFKLQAIFLVPLWCVLWYSGRVKFKHLLLFPVSYFATILPALALGKPLGDILGVYFNQMGLYNDRLTLNAPSLYALIPYGMEVDGAFWSKVGIVLAFAFVLGLLAWLFFYRKKLTDNQLLTAALILAIGVPLLLPHMHDRYFFLADALSVVWAVGAHHRTPVPVCVQIASLGGYHAYLVLRYAFPMAWGAWLLVFSLAGLLLSLGWSLKSGRPAPSN